MKTAIHINSRRLVGMGSRAVVNTDPARITTMRRVSRGRLDQERSRKLPNRSAYWRMNSAPRKKICAEQ
jgi:hypothetical protein